MYCFHYISSIFQRGSILMNYTLETIEVLLRKYNAAVRTKQNMRNKTTTLELMFHTPHCDFFKIPVSLQNFTIEKVVCTLEHYLEEANTDNKAIYVYIHENPHKISLRKVLDEVEDVHNRLQRFIKELKNHC